MLSEGDIPMKRTKLVTAISTIVLAVLLMTSVSGCAKNDAAPVPTEPTANVETVTPAEPESEPAQQPAVTLIFNIKEKADAIMYILLQENS